MANDESKRSLGSGKNLSSNHSMTSLKDNKMREESTVEKIHRERRRILPEIKQTEMCAKE